MAIRNRRPMIDSAEPRIRIRNRYLEAIRAGANNHDATEYANASSEDRPRFIPINVEIPILPKGYGKPGEIEQLLPKSFAKIKAPVAALPSTDLTAESVKRPMTEPEVSAVVENASSNEAPAKAVPAAPIELPDGWDTKDFPWPDLRNLCLKVANRTPHSRTDGVNLIRLSTAPKEE